MCVHTCRVCACMCPATASECGSARGRARDQLPYIVSRKRWVWLPRDDERDCGRRLQDSGHSLQGGAAGAGARVRVSRWGSPPPKQNTCPLAHTHTHTRKALKCYFS